MKTKVLIFAIIAGSFAGCHLETDVPTIPHRVELTFEVDNMGEALAVNGDTLWVEEIKFVVRMFNLITVDSEILQTVENQAFIFGYTSAIERERLILGVDIGFEDFEAFNGYEMFVNQARGEDNFLDPDFYDDPEHYSIVIIGTFNRNNFMFTSTYSFDKHFEFENEVLLDENNETLWINKLLDVEGLFIDIETNVLLNPLNEDHQNEIETRLEENIRVEATAASRFF